MRLRNLLIGLVAIGALGAGYVLLNAMAGPSDRPGLSELVRGEMQKFTLAPHRPAVTVRPFVDARGEAIDLAQFRGQVVLMNLWATWCAPCIEEMPHLDALQAALGGDEFQVVAVSLDAGGLDEAGSFLAQLGIDHLALYNDASMGLGTDLGAPGLPATLLIDRDGREVGRLYGIADWQSADAKRLVRYIIENG